jgi:CheY-like chemotaxis protein
LNEPHCILVVEDHPDILRIIQVALMQRGYDVRTATRAYEALDILETGQPQLLILDLMLPDVSGWDLLAIRAKDPKLRRIPTIVVTATDAFDHVDAAMHGVFAVLRKPFDPLVELPTLAESGLRAFAANDPDPA